MSKKAIVNTCIVIGCYVLWALAYPPFPFGLASLILFVPIFVITRSLTRRQAFRIHFLGGIFYNAIMYYWLYNVMKVGPAAVILLGLGVLVVFFSTLNGYLGWLYKVTQEKKAGWLLYALLWTGFEVLRTKGQMSFPWSHLGYTLGDYLGLIQFSSLVGVFGVSFGIILCNLWIEKCWVEKKWKAMSWVLCIVLLLWGFGELRLSRVKDEGVKTADIALVQPSIEQTKKWDEVYFAQVMKQTWATMDSSNLKKADLIVLAETAVPAFLKQRPEVMAELWNRTDSLKGNVLVGSLDYAENDHPARPFFFYNSAFLFEYGNTEFLKQYSKLHLVPFSERLPFDNIFPVINYVNLGEGDFAEGDGIKIWGDQFTYSPSICYEVVYPRFIREIKKTGVDLMVNITNDGWFGYSPAPFQHANICKFRAVETGMSIARCANSGISLFYDAYGRTLGETQLFERKVLRKKVPLHRIDTFYQSWGNWIEGFFFWFWVLFQGGLVGVWVKEKFWPARPRHNSLTP